MQPVYGRGKKNDERYKKESSIDSGEPENEWNYLFI